MGFMRKFILCFLIFFSIISIYKLIYPNPRNWYDHYRFLAQSFLQGRLDTPNLPTFYQDSLEYQGKKYLPFPPIPALVLAPIIAIRKNVTQQQVSIIIGAINAVLVFLLLKKFTIPTSALLLTVFFALGTVAFWSSVVGTTWYFAHNTALMFFLLSLIAFKNKKDFLSGLFLTFASLCRLPIFLGIVFYIFELRKQKG